MFGENIDELDMLMRNFEDRRPEQNFSEGLANRWNPNHYYLKFKFKTFLIFYGNQKAILFLHNFCPSVLKKSLNMSILILKKLKKNSKSTCKDSF